MKRQATYRFRRAGVSLFELAIALFLVTTAMVTMVQLLAVTAAQRRNLEHRRLALQEVANQAERIALLSWEATAADRLMTWQPSEDLKNRLPNATCTAEVNEESGVPRARKIRLSISWPNAVGQTMEPVAVTVWKYPSGGGP